MPYLTEEVPILEPHRPHDLADHVQLCHGVSGNGRVREKVPVAVVRAMPRKPRSRSVPGTTHAAGREGVRSRVRASVLERRRARGRGAVCAPGAPRPRNLDDRSRQFEFFFSPAMMLKTRVDAFKPRRKSHSVIGVLKRTPRTKPPPVWVPLPPAWVIISPRRREARDDRRRETCVEDGGRKKKSSPARARTSTDVVVCLSRIVADVDASVCRRQKIASTYAVFSAQ
jgi:hypothetical protein